MANKYTPFTPEQRIAAFWAKINKNGSIPAHCPELGNCWVWTGNFARRGYGMFRYEGWIQRAHRVMWKLKYGEIPDGLCICHKCDNPSCVNPDHLFIGTHTDNMRDMTRKGRNKFLRNEDCPTHKLSNAQVIEIRQRYAMGDISSIKLGHEYGVSKTTILRIIKNKGRILPQED